MADHAPPVSRRAFITVSGHITVSEDDETTLPEAFAYTLESVRSSPGRLIEMLDPDTLHIDIRWVPSDDT